jgi:hypothetical protein
MPSCPEQWRTDKASASFRGHRPSLFKDYPGMADADLTMGSGKLREARGYSRQNKVDPGQELGAVVVNAQLGRDAMDKGPFRRIRPGPIRDQRRQIGRSIVHRGTEATRVVDRRGTVLLDQPDDGTGDRPEVLRGDLRRILPDGHRWVCLGPAAPRSLLECFAGMAGA